VFDSSTGFTLPDRSVFSPDASWISLEKWNAIPAKDKDRFAPICPVFVIEVRAKSDNLDTLRKKMEVWITNKAALAWLIDPIEKNCYIFREDGSGETIKGFDVPLRGEGPLSGFELDLSSIR
jgi:Uma2 family endonuclease